MKSAKEIRRAIESKVVTYGWWRVCEDVEELLIQWEKDVRADQQKKDAKIADDYAERYFCDMEGEGGEEFAKMTEGQRASCQIRNSIELQDFKEGVEDGVEVEDGLDQTI